MWSYHFVIRRDPETKLLVGYLPGWHGAHTQYREPSPSE